jgi:hypothetical protein
MYIYLRFVLLGSAAILAHRTIRGISTRGNRGMINTVAVLAESW